MLVIQTINTKVRQFVHKIDLQRNQLVGSVALLSYILTFVDQVYKPGLRNLEHMHELFGKKFLLQKIFLDYLGDIEWGTLVFPLIAILGSASLHILYEKTNRKEVKIARDLWPYFILLFLMIYIIDTETGQHLVGSFGDPHKLDTFAGDLGALGGAYVVSWYLTFLSRYETNHQLQDSRDEKWVL